MTVSANLSIPVRYQNLLQEKYLAEVTTE